MKTISTYIVLLLIFSSSTQILFSQNDYKYEKYFKSLDACPDTSKDWEEMECTYVSIEYPVFFQSQYSSKLNQLIKSLIHSFFFEKYYNSFDDFTEQFFQDYWKEQLEMKTINWSNNINFEIINNTNNFVSLVSSSYDFRGGAHGWFRQVTFNYSKELNRVIFLDDIFSLFPEGKSNLNKILNKQLNVELRKVGKNENPEYIDFFDETNYAYGDIYKRFLIDKDSLVIVLDYYDEMGGTRIGAGISGFKIPFSLLSHLIKKDCPLDLK